MSSTEQSTDLQSSSDDFVVIESDQEHRDGDSVEQPTGPDPIMIGSASNDTNDEPHQSEDFDSDSSDDPIIILSPDLEPLTPANVGTDIESVVTTGSVVVDADLKSFDSRPTSIDIADYQAVFVLPGCFNDDAEDVFAARCDNYFKRLAGQSAKFFDVYVFADAQLMVYQDEVTEIFKEGGFHLIQFIKLNDNQPVWQAVVEILRELNTISSSDLESHHYDNVLFSVLGDVLESNYVFATNNYLTTNELDYCYGNFTLVNESISVNESVEFDYVTAKQFMTVRMGQFPITESLSNRSTFKESVCPIYAGTFAANIETLMTKIVDVDHFETLAVSYRFHSNYSNSLDYFWKGLFYGLLKNDTLKCSVVTSFLVQTVKNSYDQVPIGGIVPAKKSKVHKKRKTKRSAEPETVKQISSQQTVDKPTIMEVNNDTKLETDSVGSSGNKNSKYKHQYVKAKDKIKHQKSQIEDLKRASQQLREQNTLLIKDKNDLAIRLNESNTVIESLRRQLEQISHGGVSERQNVNITSQSDDEIFGSDDEIFGSDTDLSESDISSVGSDDEIESITNDEQSYQIGIRNDSGKMIDDDIYTNDDDDDSDLDDLNAMTLNDQTEVYVSIPVKKNKSKKKSKKKRKHAKGSKSAVWPNNDCLAAMQRTLNTMYNKTVIEFGPCFDGTNGGPNSSGSHDIIASYDIEKSLLDFQNGKTKLKHADNSVDVICIAMPYRHRNQALLPAFAKEIGRVCREAVLISVGYNDELSEDLVLERVSKAMSGLKRNIKSRYNNNIPGQLFGFLT